MVTFETKAASEDISRHLPALWARCPLSFHDVEKAAEKPGRCRVTTSSRTVVVQWCALSKAHTAQVLSIHVADVVILPADFAENVHCLQEAHRPHRHSDMSPLQ